MSRFLGLAAEIDVDALPLLPEVEALARAGTRTGASARNWDSYGAAVDLPPHLEAWRRDILTDPQTSGGLLIAVAPDDERTVFQLAERDGSAACAVVGRMTDGAPRVRIRTQPIDVITGGR